MRSAMHRAGAAVLSQLLQFPVPAPDQRRLPCPCGQQAVYRELRPKPVLTAVGEVTVSRPYYLCPHCHRGQFPADVELDIANTEFSPGVRRMQALVGQQAPFEHGREQMKLLAGLEVNAKAVERTAEAIGGDIAAREQQQIERALQLALPVLVGEPIPILYIEMDGTGVPVVRKETTGRKGKTDGELAAVLSLELGKMVAEREALASPQMRAPEGRPPMEVPIGNAAQFSAPDLTRMAELAPYDHERQRAGKRLPPLDPSVLARGYLEKAGHSKADLDAVAPLLSAAERNCALEKLINVTPSGPSWTPQK